MRGTVSVCHHYSTSDCQAVSHVSQAFCSSRFFLLCPICVSSLHPASLFPWQLSLHPLHVEAPSALPLPSVHSSACSFLPSSSPSWRARSLLPLRFSTLRLVIERLAPPALLSTPLFHSLHRHTAHSCYSPASVLCRACMLACTCAKRAKQSTNIFFLCL